MNRTKLLLVAGLVVLLAAGTITAVALTSQQTPPAARPCNIPRSVALDPVPAKTAPGGGGIRVTEKGFSFTNGSLSAGAIVTNTSDRIAYKTKVDFRLYYPEDDVEPGSSVQGAIIATLEVPVIMPDQRVGVGVGAGTAADDVASIRVEPGATTWLRRSKLGSFMPTTTSGIRTIRDNSSPRASVVRYSEESGNCRALGERGATVVFRDAAGKIVGGDAGRPDGKGDSLSRPPPVPASPSCSPGTRETWLPTRAGVPPTTDDKRTTVYSYCDPDPTPMP